MLLKSLYRTFLKSQIFSNPARSVWSVPSISEAVLDLTHNSVIVRPRNLFFFFDFQKLALFHFEPLWIFLLSFPMKKYNFKLAFGITHSEEWPKWTIWDGRRDHGTNEKWDWHILGYGAATFVNLTFCNYVISWLFRIWKKSYKSLSGDLLCAKK